MSQQLETEGNGVALENQLVKRCLLHSRLLSHIALVFPLLAAVGWILDIEILKQVHSSLPPMQPNTAGLLVLAAITLYFSQEGVPNSIRLLNSFTAFVISTLGLLTLCEYLMGLDFGIDRIFIDATPTSVQPFPGRPSPQASLNFVFLGIGLVFYNLRTPSVRFGQVCALIVGANSIIAFTGYIFSTKEFYGFPKYAPAIGLAVPTALTFLILVLSLLCSRPRDGLMSLVTSETQSGSMARSILFAGIFIPPLVGAITRIGVVTKLYDESFHISLFAAVIVGIILRTTWNSARFSEKIELKEKAALEQLDLALRGANLGLWDWNIKTGRVEFNNRWAEMRGFHRDEIKPHVETWISSLHPEDLPRIQKTLDDYFHERIPEYESEFRVLTKSGKWIWVLDRGKVFERDSEGRPARMLGTELDITERKRLEEAVRLSEAKASGILSISADAIISIDEDQKIIMFNEGAEKIFGYLKSEIIGQPIEILIPERFRAVHRHLVEKFSKEEGTSRRMGDGKRSISGIRKNGEEFPAETSISKLEIGGTKIFSADLRDMTDHQRREDQLQRAIKTREDVLAIVSHDLKNPVSVIGLTAQMLHKMEKVDAKRLHDLADKIQCSTEQMQKLIGDLLDFSKIESGTFSVDPYAENLSYVLRPVVDGVRTLAESRKQIFDASFASDLPEVACDAARIGRVMSNLLGNAIKFTPEGGTIRVSAIQQGDSVIVSVSDTGSGIPSEQSSKIFDRYWQPKETQKQGSGLGLSIAKGIVEAHGGRIWAESILGVGANFHFTIPLATGETKRRVTSSDSRRIIVENGSSLPSPPSLS